MSRNPTLNILDVLRVAEHNRVTYYPAFAHCLGNDVAAALFASNFLFWKDKQADPEGWVYKNRDEIMRETGMNRKLQEGARKRLVDYGVLEEEKRGLPRKLYYRFDWDHFASLVQAHFEDLNAGRLPEEEPEEPIMDAMRAIFDKFYEAQAQGVAFAWGSTKERGKHFGSLKKLAELLAERISTRKTRDAAKLNNGMTPAGFKPDATNEEILVSWQAFLDNLPEFFRTKRLTPADLYSDFSKIILEVTNHVNSTPKPARNTGTNVADAI